MILGIDPGAKGGLAVLNGAGVPIFSYSFTDRTIRETVSAVQAAALLTAPFNVCYLEKVGFIRGDGGQGSFTFGKVYGILYGAALCCGLEVRDVYPMVWQSSLGCLTQGQKNVSKRKAQELFPGMKVNHYIADALLIAEYGRRRELGLR